MLFSRPYDLCFFFFFNDTATTEIYTLSLHDALPISRARRSWCRDLRLRPCGCARGRDGADRGARRNTPRRRAPRRARGGRSEEHTSELQSQSNLVCRLLLEKKKNIKHYL